MDKKLAERIKKVEQELADIKKGAECKKKPIEFVRYIRDVDSIEVGYYNPVDWDNVELLWHDSCGFDIIKAWNYGLETEAVIYVGYWNDGVKE